MKNLWSEIYQISFYNCYICVKCSEMHINSGYNVILTLAYYFITIYVT